MNNENIQKQIIEIITKVLEKPKNPSCIDYKNPQELNKILRLGENMGNKNWEDVFEVVNQYLQYSLHANHSQFFNQMWSGGSLPARLGEMITACMNTSMYTYEVAPVATLMERWMIKTLLNILEFQQGEGLMTSGSSNGNQIALLLARNEYNESLKENGLFHTSPLRVYISEDAHYSFDKAMNVLGMGTENLVKISTDKNGKMNLQILIEKIEEDIQNGFHPLVVVATAGTTVRGSYDPIYKLVMIKKKYNIWLHVDGAWGGVVFLEKDLSTKYLQNIKMVDSFTFDAHKMLSVPLMCSFLFINNKPQLLLKTCNVGDSSYIFHEDQEDSYDLGPSSLQCGRRVDILKFYLEWQYYGRKGLGERVKNILKLMEYAEKKVDNDSSLKLFAKRESFNLCFYYECINGIDKNSFMKLLRNNLYHKGYSFINYSIIHGVTCMRLVITNNSLQIKDIDIFFDALKKEAVILEKSYNIEM
jgi:glutamate/tyrosine decarboxylase-like PLP-dependent enzyme